MGRVACYADTAGMETLTTDSNKVFLAEHSPAIRMRLAAMLGKVDGVAIVGEAGTAASAIEGILRTLPHSVVLDIHLVGGSGIDVLRKVKLTHPNIVFIVLTNHAEPQYRK